MEYQNNAMYLISKDDLQTLLRSEMYKIVNDAIDRKVIRQPKVLSRSEAAAEIGVCENTISEYVKQGRLENRGIGRKVLILDTDLVKLKPKNYNK